MKIIILGAGRVGYSVAESLVSERNDITVIDIRADHLQALQERFDLRCITGNGMDAQVLAEAGAQDTDLLIACTAQDETNLVCCKVAHMLFGIPRRIARVRSSAFEAHPDLMGTDGFAVDAIICPEASLTRYIAKLVEFPASLQVRSFAGGRVVLASVRVRLGVLADGLKIGELPRYAPELQLRVVAIYRRFADGPDRFVRCNGRTRIEAGDEVFVLAEREHLKQVLTAFYNAPGQPARIVRRIMLVGGGVVIRRLVNKLWALRQQVADLRHLQIKVLSDKLHQCQALAAQLPQEVLVLHGNLADEELLAEEHIEQVDFFLALTDDDENNIMASLLAKRLGARRVLALIHRRSYADLMHGTQIDIALTPSQAMLGELLAHVRKGDVQAVHSLRRGVAEALEIVVRGDQKTSRVVGREVASLRLPEDVHIGLIVRNLPEDDAPHRSLSTSTLLSNHAVEGRSPNTIEGRSLSAVEGNSEPEIIFPRRNTVIQSNDHIVFFLPNKHLVADVEQLFRVGAMFL
ncbi:MAG: Trk system potassium transporter TrkA [Comamonas sp.]|nr:Trk system potassium transporter TrkA [Comamonas sp.]